MQSIPHMFLISRCGVYTYWWNDEAHRVEIRAHKDRKKTSDWPSITVAYWHEEPSLSEVVELVARERGGHRNPRANEIVFLLDAAYTAEAHLEHAHSDVHNHGDVCVTY